MGTRLASFIQAGKIALIITSIVAEVFVLGCSKGQNAVGGPTPTPTPATPRMLVSDNTSGTINVVNAQTDVVTHTIAVPSPGKMVSAGGTTLIQSTIASTLTIFDNATETIRFSMTLPAQPLDIAITPDGKTGWVAENNGTVQSIATASGTVSGTFTVAGVQRLAIGPQGTTILAFNDTLAINFTVIGPTGLFVIGNTGLDHPANAFFLGDDNHFTVADCGVECVGTQANIVDVSLNNIGGPGVSPPLSLSGATVVAGDSTQEFVAGSPATGLNAGTLQVVSRATFTAGTAFNIADGRHDQMALTSNGRLYVGSTGCTLGAVNTQNLRQGCLAIFDTVSHAVTPVLLLATRPNGDVTSLAPVSGRNVIYVVEGGKVDIFDITTNAVSTTAIPPNIPGTVFGAVQLSP